MKILVVEDNVATLKMLAILLTRWGYDVDTAEDGRRALDIINGPEPPRLYILDWMMPELSGLELCKLIRSSTSGIENGYIVLLTGRTETRDIVTGLQAGADDYIAKPFHPEELRSRIGSGKRIIDLQDALDRRGKTQGVLEMAGAVCHELNQPLQAIMGYTNLILMDMDPDHPLQEGLRVINTQVERMAVLTRKLMRIARYETREYVDGQRIVDIDRSVSEDYYNDLNEK
ncbi:MAG: response regulator [Desulfosudaceae bacterium]